MKLKVFFYCLLLFAFIEQLHCQSDSISFNKNLQLAKKSEKRGNYSEAARFYESAFNKKNNRKDLAAKAGLNYYESKQYSKASELLLIAKNISGKKYDKIGYYYALSLKQNSQFEEALAAFQDFELNYSGTDKEEMSNKIKKDIEGISFARNNLNKIDPNLQISILDNNINSDKNDIAPIPFKDNVLYFTSNTGSKYALFRSQKNSDSTWSKKKMPSIFVGKIEKEYFGDGCMTPDGRRYFFTQCDIVNNEKINCELYIIYEERGSWSQPLKLPEIINTKGTNNMHPSVAVFRDYEILYFVSDRIGSVGGQDLWYSIRTIKTNEYTEPENLGSNINTIEDDISPFYDTKSRTLYYSSNGKITIGGFDIYRANGEKNTWSVPENIGFPYNSYADDLFYVVSESHEASYVSSNRSFEDKKLNTDNLDIFRFESIKNILTIKGDIFAKNDPDKKRIENIQLSVSEKIGEKELLVKSIIIEKESSYSFDFLPKKEYIIKVNVTGYNNYSSIVDTKKQKNKELRIIDIELEKISEPDLSLIVSKTFNSPQNSYKLPTIVPIDERTGEPYSEDSEIYKAFIKANEIAEKANDRKLYWNNNELVPFFYQEEGDDVESSSIIELNKKELSQINQTESDKIKEKEISNNDKYLIVPQEFNSESNPYILPKEIPIDPKTNEPYKIGSPEYLQFMKVDSIASLNSERKVYWDKDSLKFLKESEPEISYNDIKNLIVPEQYNSPSNSYTIPGNIPIDPKTGKPFKEGSVAYNFYMEAKKIASESPESKVYWENNQLLPYIPDNNIDVSNSVELTYKIQIAAHRRLKPENYEQVIKDKFKEIKIDYEKIDNGITRVLLVPADLSSNAFKTLDDAVRTLRILYDETKFDSSFIAIYRNNKRTDKIIRLNNLNEFDNIIEDVDKDLRYSFINESFNSEENSFEVIDSVLKKQSNLVGRKNTEVIDEIISIASKSPYKKVYWKNNELIPLLDSKDVDENIVFVVQLIALKNVNYRKSLKKARDKFPNLYFYEELNPDGLYRILATPIKKNSSGNYGFKSRDEAFAALRQIVYVSEFKKAFIAKYKGNQRLDGILKN